MRILHLFFPTLLPCAFLILACGQDPQMTEAEDRVEEETIVWSDTVIAYSLLGEPLKPVPERISAFHEKDSLLTVAEQAYREDPLQLDNVIWYGRRLSYLTRYREAMTVYTTGLHLFPQSPEIYRHRGHRYLSIRRFEEAVNDLRLAAELARGRPVQTEPDGLPNAQNIPLSTLQFNIWYHMALAYYLHGKYTDAAVAYDSCMVYATNDDLLCATTFWYYLTLRRMGDHDGAGDLLRSIRKKMDIIENMAYHQNLLVFKGVQPVDVLLEKFPEQVAMDIDVVTKANAAGQYFLLNGDKVRAHEIFQQILGSEVWPAFGYIAAEAEIARG